MCEHTKNIPSFNNLTIKLCLLYTTIMSNRGLKKQYDRKVLETFDIIGCYFIDLFYNDLFLKAKHIFTTGNAKSLTDVYRSHIIWFMRGIKEKPKNYIDVMKKLLDYYNSATKTITSTLAELENKILSQFIPAEYYQDFNNSNKEKTLHDVIIKAINQLGEIVLEPQMLGKIIDDHLNQGNIQLLQEKMTDIFISQREEYYSQFVNEISRASGNTTVSRDQFKKLKAAYADEVKKRVAAEAERDKAIQLLQASLQKISILEQSQISQNYIPTTPVKAAASFKDQRPAVVANPERDVSAQTTLPEQSLNIVGSVGLKLSDLTIDDNILVDVNNDVKSANTEDSDDGESADSEEIHRMQKEKLKNKRNENPLELEDDPGFGN